MCASWRCTNSTCVATSKYLYKHGYSVFHSLTCSQEWTGTFFRKTSLRKVGLTIHLGHYDGDVCTNPNPRTLTIIHTTGIHLVDIWFCGCNQASNHGDHIQQLLQCDWFPTTTTNPQTVATYALLEYAHIISVQSKLSLYNYYISIEILTDATYTSGIKVCTQQHWNQPAKICTKNCYWEFLRMVQMWHHLHLLKWGRRAHAETSVNRTSPGELTILCSACPHPNINLLANWTSTVKGSEYVFRFSLFCLPPPLLLIFPKISLLSVLWDWCMLPFQTSSDFQLQ